MKDKKNYLKSYRLQENIIRTFLRLKAENPTQGENYNQKIAECEKSRIEIAERINQLEDLRLKVVLYEKYINGRTLEEISQILNYSKRHTERLHIAALKAFKL